ncbi:MAG: hypothetical protein IJC93_01470 [Clostridia bacterium]|nr:hypothetical protein [Clostridia bacterium]
MAINIGTRLEPLWDDTILDPAKTTAELRRFSPVKREKVMEFGEPWEGDGCDYFNFLCDNGLWRMYYLAWKITEDGRVPDHHEIRVCYAESRDGLHWEKPALGLCEFNGSKENNILLDENTQKFDNFFVFIDQNPNCPPEERFKAVAQNNGPSGLSLLAYLSADGIHFTPAHTITTGDYYDSLNTAFYDTVNKRYVAYVRGFHSGKQEGGVRDIRYLTSPDFVNWSRAEELTYSDPLDIPLYTNVISPYYRAPHVFVGFPSRYIERKAWTKNYDRLCGKEMRRRRMEASARYGLAVTDCIFMSSRDGAYFTRYQDAFLRPGAENGRNWVYGDCYPAYGMLETPSADRGAASELSMFVFENHWQGIPTELYRYTNRIDGFAGLSVGSSPKVAVTKPLVFAGSELVLNFATSARGSLFVTIEDADGNRLESGELFGDSIERVVDFDGDLSAFAGKPVSICFTMEECDLFSLRFAAQTKE